MLEVPPAPGRVVLLDQDITHAVSRPRAAARARARYSLVLKLVLHPREGGAAPRLAPASWGPPRLFGSAATERAPD